MITELKAPSIGESITEVRIAGWKAKTGEAVKAGDVLIEIESDKATVEVVADTAGVLQIVKAVGEMAKIGEVLGTLDDSGSAIAPAPVISTAPVTSTATGPLSGELSPSVRKMSAENNIDLSTIQGTGRQGRVTKGDLMAAAATEVRITEPRDTRLVQQTRDTQQPTRERRVPMSLLRQKIAERLVLAQHTAAILTTFNECDMSAVMDIRAKNKETFKAKYGVNLGFMSFFTRAVIEALKEVPAVNGMVDGKDVIYRDYFDIGVAIGSERGLVVPVLRDAGKLDFAGIEKGIAVFAEKAKAGKLSIADLTGGTFTISNGGTYGSLLSTPILNPPQSGILGMHKIMDRAVVVGGQIVARPMMFVALSYDHRMIDGKEAVTFLVKVKEGIENPVEKLGFKL